MDDLLPHYEAELRLLCADAAHFAKKHPALAQQLERSRRRATAGTNRPSA